MAARASKKKTFQERMDDLAHLVEELEGGDLDLEAAIKKYEEGRVLERELLAELKSYEKRLDVLMNDGESGRVEPAADPPPP